MDLKPVTLLAALKLPINVNVVVPAVENLPGSKATVPSAIVKSMSGQTIEILNTDAEGRLILCDALTYSRRFKPAAIIDVANKTRKDHIITVEDPIEFALQGVRQSQINAKIGLDYADLLRNVLRHAPDVIMIGDDLAGQTGPLIVDHDAVKLAGGVGRIEQRRQDTDDETTRNEQTRNRGSASSRLHRFPSPTP